MDRNVVYAFVNNLFRVVATREGGVDRNAEDGSWTYFKTKSPPARVAWIETLTPESTNILLPVATREGGVDRNV